MILREDQWCVPSLHLNGEERPRPEQLAVSFVQDTEEIVPHVVLTGHTSEGDRAQNELGQEFSTVSRPHRCQSATWHLCGLLQRKAGSRLSHMYFP
jgi:hypothetical protein